MDPNNIVLIVVGLVILWVVWKSRQKSRTPEAPYAAAELTAAKQDALAALPEGWVLSHPDRERFGSGTDGVAVCGVVTTGPDGQGVLGLALSKPAALRTAAAAVRGEMPLTDAWAPPVSDLSTGTVSAPAHGDAALPIGWSLIDVDRESFSTEWEPVSAYGALAIGPGGRRALAVAQDRATALDRLVDLIEGRLAVTDTCALQLNGLESRQQHG